MRTRKTRVTFKGPFTLNGEVSELPAGSYEVEIDEEEIVAIDRTGYRRIATYFHVETRGSTRTLIIEPADLDAALARDGAEEAPRP